MKRMTLINDRWWMEEDGKSNTCSTLDKSGYELWWTINNEMEGGNENGNKWIGNYIGDEGASKISETLKVNTTLTELYLNGDEQE